MDKAEIILFYDTNTETLELTNREDLTCHANTVRVKATVEIDADYDVEDGQYIFCGSVKLGQWVCDKNDVDVHTMLEHVAPEFLEKLEARLEEFIEENESDFVQYGKVKGAM